MRSETEVVAAVEPQRARLIELELLAPLLVVFERRLLPLEEHAVLKHRRASISVRMKQRYASSSVHTIGSPRTLNDVLTMTGQPVF